MITADRAINIGLGIFIIRFSLAIIFMAHGIQKFINLTATIGFFENVGLVPFFAYFVAAVETLSGLAMLLGIWTKLAGALIVAVMLFAIYLVKYSAGFFGGYEYDLVLMLMALSVILTGSGKYSVKLIKE